MMELSKTCTACPRGCRLRIGVTGGTVVVHGYRCLRGEEYGREEATEPRRILTSTVRTLYRREPRLPVKTSGTIPLREFPRAMARINALCIRSPVHCGQVLEHDFLGTGADLVATDELPYGQAEEERKG
jgi:CxxC motif-containing protein